MSAKQIGNSIYVGQKDLCEFIGTASEMTDVGTNTLAPGSSYWATDEKKGYVWDGETWNALS